MDFASYYLGKHFHYKPFIHEEPVPGTSLAVVIPSFNEPDILMSLQSLYNADRPSFPVEVIVTVNSPEGAGNNVFEQNRKTVIQVRDWSRRNSRDNFMVHVMDVPPFPKKHAGAGYARKTGMDEALYRFNSLGNEKGIIVSFDADSTCDTNYFTGLEKCFSFDEPNGCTIYFEHPLDIHDQSPLLCSAITEYELYLRYYVEAMRMAGFPFAFHTIGSCFAVNAKIYATQGGMNRKTAGEDFYFLHKLFPLGNFTELNNTRVVPSSRVSDRVPFGTGATMKKFAAGRRYALKTYPLESFDDLAVLFSLIHGFFGASKKDTTDILKTLPVCLKNFLTDNGFTDAVLQMNIHSAEPRTFRKRFFAWFNAFRLLKFLNYCRENYREDQSVTGPASTLIERLGKKPGSQSRDLLLQYRELQRNVTWKC